MEEINHTFGMLKSFSISALGHEIIFIAKYEGSLYKSLE